MALFPPGKGGGEEVAYGGKGKGILIHTLTDNLSPFGLNQEVLQPDAYPKALEELQAEGIEPAVDKTRKILAGVKQCFNYRS